VGFLEGVSVGEKVDEEEGKTVGNIVGEVGETVGP